MTGKLKWYTREYLFNLEEDSVIEELRKKIRWHTENEYLSHGASLKAHQQHVRISRALPFVYIWHFQIFKCLQILHEKMLNIINLQENAN